jgi:hypothetical protein
MSEAQTIGIIAGLGGAVIVGFIIATVYVCVIRKFASLVLTFRSFFLLLMPTVFFDAAASTLN